MHWGPKKNAGVPIELKLDLRKVSDAAAPPPDDALYPYLKMVYRLRRKLDGYENKVLDRAFSELAKRTSPRINKNYIRAIIETTAGAHVTTKMKGKYADALSLCYALKVHPNQLIEHIKTNGGINGCVEKYRVYKRRNPVT